MIEYKPGRIKDHLDQLEPMFAAHWKELKLSNMDFDLDIEGLTRYEEAGNLFSIGAFEGEKIVGYACYICTTHPLNKNVWYASAIAFYVEPEYRRKRVGYNLIKTSEILLKGKVEWIDLPIPKQFKSKKWLPFLGYNREEIIYRRPIGG